LGEEQMTNEEIRKLLGGYATNSLTDAEQKTLYQAALEDQELFNAMQDEEALRDLLADPVSRAQVQRALEQPPRPKPAWWARRWTWAGASAIAAAVIIVGAVRMNTASKRLEQAQALDVLSTPPQAPPPVTSSESVKEPATPKPAAQQATPQAKVAANAAPQPKDQKAAGSLGRAEDDFRAGARQFDREKKADAIGRGGVVGGVATSSTPAAPAAPPPPATARPSQEVAQTREQVQVQPAGQAGGSQSAAQNSNVSQNQATPNQAAQNQATQNQAGHNQAAQNPASPTINGSPLSPRNELRDAENARLASSFAARPAGPSRTVTYIIVRRDASGNYLALPPSDGLKVDDEVRLNVVPSVSGLLTLDLVDASGNTSRVFPAGSAGLAVVANTSYTIPNSPIAVKESDQKYRITLNVDQPLAETATTTGVRASARKAKAGIAEPLLKQGRVLQPIDVIIGPKK
jgi:hypothetical protein